METPRRLARGLSRLLLEGGARSRGILNWVFVWWLSWQDGCRLILLSTYCTLSTRNPDLFFLKGLFFLEGKQASLTEEGSTYL